jgi:hypothetical protein
MLSKPFLLLAFTLVAGCGLLPPYNLTEVAFIRVFNQVETDISYQANMFSRWTDLIPIKPNNTDFLFEYDRKTKKEALPNVIHSIKILLPDCLLVLNRKHLEDIMVQPLDDGAGWNLYVTQELVRKIGCYTQQ